MTDSPNASAEDHTLDEFHSPEPDTEWQCTVCGAVGTDEEEIRDCHSKFAESYRKFSPEPGDSPRFVYPTTLDDSLIERCEAVRRAIHDQEDEHPLTCAGEEMVSAVSMQDEPGESDAFSLFCHLVWLQGFGVIPGYPQYTNTTTTVSLTEFCTLFDGVSGGVSESDITQSSLVSTERVYRSKVHSVTDLFWSETTLLSQSNSSPWEWKTFTSTTFPEAGYEYEYGSGEIAIPSVSDEYRDAEYEKTAVFGDSTAHNVVVTEACEWIESHPAVAWTCAPYAATSSNGVLEKDGLAEPDPSAEPLWMVDFAAFDGEQCRLLGIVVSGEPADEIFDQIKTIDTDGVWGIVVMESREAVHEFISQVTSQGWVENDLPVEQYERRPNMSAVTTEIADDAGVFSNIRFVTRKLLIDDVVDPVTLFSTSGGVDD